MKLKRKLKIAHNDQLSGQSIAMFQKIRQWVKKLSFLKFVYFTGWWPMNTKEVYPFRVVGKGQLCSLRTVVLKRKRSSG